jgi:hypothetical protein
MLLSLGAPLHGLSHALHTLKALALPAHDEPLTLQTTACDQCLQFAALEGAGPATAVIALAPAGRAAGMDIPPATRPSAAVFTAYISRAPPAIG